MKRMRKLLYSIVSLSLIVTSAWAEEKMPAASEPSDVVIQANCDLTGYKSEVQTFPAPVAIPDGSGGSVTVGPIIIPADGNMIGDVVIDITMSHTWIGDLIATVGYDATCDGSIDTQVILIGRPGRTACTPAGAPFGCSTDLVCANTYYFDDTATASLGLTATGACTLTGINPGGCYKPTGSCAGLLSVFEQFRKGGCWYLNVADLASSDAGTICAWSVHIKNNVVIGVENSTWTNLKTLYN